MRLAHEVEHTTDVDGLARRMPLSRLVEWIAYFGLLNSER